MSNDRPAKIAFGVETGHDHGDEFNPDDDIQILEEEEAEPEFESPKPRKTAAGKKKGVPGWIFAVGGGIILTAVLGGGWMAVSKINRAAARDEVMTPPQVMASQPVIQAADQFPQQQPQPLSSAPIQSAPPVQAVAVTQSGQPEQAQVQTGGASVPAPVMSGLPATAASQTAVVPERAPGVDLAKVSALENELGKALAKLDDVAKRLTKLETTQAQKEKATPEAKPKVIVAAKPATAVTKTAQVKPTPVAKQPAKSASKPAVEKPSEESSATAVPAPQARVQGYSISSIIGTRAWLVKRNIDGSESEISVSPGEKVEGRVVTSVDGSSKSVTLDGGQKIGVGR